MELISRQALIVWINSGRNIKLLRRYGHVHYYSRKMKYALMYVNEGDVEQIMAELQAAHFVRSVELSHRKEIDMQFSSPLSSHAEDIQEEEPILVDERESFIEDISKSIEARRRNESIKEDRF